jgi:hypothetical protein
MRRLILFLLILLWTAAARAGALKVEVVARVDATTALHSAASSTATLGSIVSNTDRIVMRFSIESPEITKGSPTGTSALPQFELSALDDKGNPVVVNKSVTGVNVEYSRVVVTVLVEIPIDSGERHRQVAEFVDSTIAESSGRTRELLLAQRGAAIGAVERLFVQNRLGDYRLRVTVRDPRVESAEGEVRVHVADEGTFIDKLRRRPEETKNR